MPGPQELLIIGAVALLLFGSSRIPRLMRDIGRSVSELRKGISESFPEDHS